MPNRIPADRFVYVIGSGNGVFKVGIAKNVAKRRKGLQTGYPYRLKVYFRYQTSAPIRTEALIHSLLSEYRLSGEWFQCEYSIIRSAITRAEQIRPRGAAAGVEQNWMNLH